MPEYKTPFSRDYWRTAAGELKKPKMLVFAALMIALRVALKPAGIDLGPGMRINTAFVINAMGAMTFGPVVAMAAAVVSDTLGYLYFPNGPYFFPYILEEITGSLIFALFLYRTKVTPTRVILSRFCIDFFVNILLHAPITVLYYHLVVGKSYAAFQIPHIVKNLCMFPVEGFLLTLFLSLMLPILYRAKLVQDRGDGLRFTKRHVAMLASLFVVAAGCVVGYFFYDYNTANHAPRMDADPAAMAAYNDGLTREAEEQGLLEDGQIVVMNRVYKKYHGDTTVLFNVYDTTPETDLAKIRKGIRAKTAAKDETLQKTAEGEAVLAGDDADCVSSLTIEPAAPQDPAAAK